MYLYRTEPVSHIGDVQGKGKGKGNEGGGACKQPLRLHTQRAQVVSSATNRTR